MHDNAKVSDGRNGQKRGIPDSYLNDSLACSCLSKLAKKSGGILC